MNFGQIPFFVSSGSLRCHPIALVRTLTAGIRTGFTVLVIVLRTFFSTFATDLCAQNTQLL